MVIYLYLVLADPICIFTFFVVISWQRRWICAENVFFMQIYKHAYVGKIDAMTGKTQQMMN